MTVGRLRWYNINLILSDFDLYVRRENKLIARTLKCVRTILPIAYVLCLCKRLIVFTFLFC